MEVKAFARHIRIAPRKIRLVAGLVRGLDVSVAQAQLRFMRKASAKPVLKLIQSAAANAEHNFKLSPETMYVKTIFVDGGPVMKRWRARAMGRAAGIRKRTSHITVILDERKLAGTPDKGLAEAVVKAAEPKKVVTKKKSVVKKAVKAKAKPQE
jgi:large subunit ribosomal protein L22